MQRSYETPPSPPCAISVLGSLFRAWRTTTVEITPAAFCLPGWLHLSLDSLQSWGSGTLPVSWHSLTRWHRLGTCLSSLFSLVLGYVYVHIYVCMVYVSVCMSVGTHAPQNTCGGWSTTSADDPHLVPCLRQCLSYVAHCHISPASWPERLGRFPCLPPSSPRSMS